MKEAIELLIKELEEEKESDWKFLAEACREAVTEMDRKEYMRVHGIFNARMNALGE